MYAHNLQGATGIGMIKLKSPPGGGMFFNRRPAHKDDLSGENIKQKHVTGEGWKNLHRLIKKWESGYFKNRSR